MDTCVYLKATSLDMEYVAAEAEKLGIREFEEKNRFLSLRLFGNGDLTDSDRKMLAYILSSGTFGSLIHQVTNQLRKNRWTKRQYMRHRFFVPISKKNKNYEAYAQLYPWFYDHRICLPFLPFYRTIRAVRTGRFQAKAKAILEAKDESAGDGNDSAG